MKQSKRNRIRTLENEVETLESIIKDELYKIFMEKLNETVSIKRYRTENKNLRKEIKNLKQRLLNKERKKKKCQKRI